MSDNNYPDIVYLNHVNSNDNTHFGCWHSHGDKRYHKEYIRKIKHEEIIEEYKAKCEKYKKALEFYADGEGDVLDWDRVNNPVCIQDRGKRAREALNTCDYCKEPLPCLNRCNVDMQP